MNLFINLDPLLPPLTGIGQYTHGIVSELLTSNRVEGVYGQYLSQWYEAEQIATLLHPPLVSEKSSLATFNKLVKTLPRFVAKMPGVRTTYHGVKQWRLMQKIKQKALSNTVYWEPNYVLREFPGISVPTVHDIAYIRRPEFHERSTIERLTAEVPRSIARAHHVFTVSDFSRREIIEHYQLAEDFVSVIYPGVSAAFRQHSPDELKHIRGRYALPEGFVLSLGTLEPRKNLKGLMQAYLQLPVSLRSQFPLVLVGAQGWLMHQFSQEMQQLEQMGQLIRLGYVSQHDLPALISSATVMAYVSHYEGFGMPVAEALASGTSVLTSRGTSMEEVADGAAILVDPAQTDSIAEGLLTLLEDSELRQAVIQRGLERAKAFNWATSADKMLQIFDQLQQASKR